MGYESLQDGSCRMNAFRRRLTERGGWVLFAVCFLTIEGRILCFLCYLKKQNKYMPHCEIIVGKLWGDLRQCVLRREGSRCTHLSF